jgi:hypothetical protein
LNDGNYPWGEDRKVLVYVKWGRGAKKKKIDWKEG